MSRLTAIIVGSHLLGGGKEVISVRLKNTEVAQILVGNSDSEIVVVADEGLPGPGNVTLVSDTGAIVSTACSD